MSRVLVTGAAGRLGSVLRRGLADSYELVLSDRVPIADLTATETFRQGDLADPVQAADIVRDVDAVVHAAGIPDEAPFGALLAANVVTTYNVFESARINGLARVVYASSAHVVGFHSTAERIDEHAALAPDSVYASTKVFGEALGSVYAQKFGLEVVCLRIGSFRPEPENTRQLATWLSPGDAVRLVDASLTATGLSFLTVYGVSANPGRWWSDSSAERLGYHPQSSADAFAERFSGAPADGRWQGGVFAEPDYLGGQG